MSNPSDEPTLESGDAASRAIARGQLVPRSPRGGVQAVWRCEECGRPWVMDGPRAILRPDPEELARWVARLHANLDNLPPASCRACDALRAGVELMVDEYGAGRGGWGISVEHLDREYRGGPLDGAPREPAPTHLLGSIFNMDWMARQAAATAIHAGLVTRTSAYRQAMRWLAKLLEDMRVGRAPHMTVITYDDEEQGGEMAADNPPGFGLVPTTGPARWVWRGAIIPAQGPVTYCPALGGQALINLAIALPYTEPLHPPSLLRVWESVAGRAVDIPLAGAASE